MAKFIDDFNAALTAVHSEHDIEQEVTDKVLAAASAAQATAFAQVNTSIADLQTALNGLVAKLSAGDTAGAQSDANNASIIAGSIVDATAAAPTPDETAAAETSVPESAPVADSIPVEDSANTSAPATDNTEAPVEKAESEFANTVS